MNPFIEIKGARIHNLKNIDIQIPRGKLTVITGVSGSGKSSLAFDTLYEEGKRRYLMFSGTQFMVDTATSFDQITGLSPTVAVEQRVIRQSNPRSTVGTRTKISNMLAVLFATYGKRDPVYDDGMPLAMEMFQRNSPKGMCVKCLGHGMIHSIDEARIFEEGSTKRIKDVLIHGILYNGGSRKRLDDFCAYYGITAQQPLDTLTDTQLLAFKYGDHGKTEFQGVIPWLMHILKWGEVSGRKNALLVEAYGNKINCTKCDGTGLSEQAMHTTIAGRSITELEHLYIHDLYKLLQTEKASLSGANLIHEIMIKLECMVDVGLHHLSLSRPVPTLSGGEIQRLFLASFIIAEMDSIIFVFDEPTIGLHEVEKAKLIQIIRNLVKRGNTVIAVEHDENFMREADYIIDLGPGAGEYGGELIFQGSFEQFMTCEHSKTAPYLANRSKMPYKTEYKPVEMSRMLTIENASLNNLCNITVDIPLGLLVGIAGVSGSGKSSLISGTLVPMLKHILKNKFVSEDNEDIAALPNMKLSGVERIKKCVVIDQKPIGRSRTSCPATYIGIFDRIRSLFAGTQDAVEKGYTAALFSVNSEGGCRLCKGDGVTHFYVGYGNFIDLECESCGGTGFIEDAMEILLEGKNIKQVLEFSVNEALAFFNREESTAFDKSIVLMLQMLEQVGMGYIKLGQKTPTISGGESQRIKLAKELGKKNVGSDCLYILDEPTTGLSFSDSERLIQLMLQLTATGNTVIVTEHDPAVLSNCDYIIELGSGGGSEGGRMIASGTPLQLKQNGESIIGRYLKC